MSAKNMQASPATTPVTKRLSILRDLWPFLRPYRGKIALAFVLLCLASATLLLVPLAFRDLIDFGFGQHAKPGTGLLGAASLNGHFGVLFGLACFWAMMVAARYYTVTWIGERVTADLRSAVYARVLEQSPQFFETLQTGEVLSRLTGDTTLIQTVIGSSISMGLRSLFQFIGGMVLVAGVVGTMAEVWGDVMRAAGATERLLELLHAKPTIIETNTPERLPHPGKAEIRFEHVSFRYPSRKQTAALDDITLDIASGESIALVGPSGAGKTTLFQLLLRFYDVSHGTIRFLSLIHISEPTRQAE